MKKKSVTKKGANSKKNVPTVVKIISVIYFIGAFLDILAGLAILMFKEEDLVINLGVSITSPAMLMVVGLLVLAFGVFYLFIGKDLWKGKSWARTAAIVTSSLSALFYFINLVFGRLSIIIFFLFVYLLILWYLLFNKKVKSAFS